MSNYTLIIDINNDINNDSDSDSEYEDSEQLELYISIKNINNQIINEMILDCKICDEHDINYENIVFNTVNGDAKMSIIGNRFMLLNFDARNNIHLSITYELTNKEITQFKTEMNKLRTITFK